MNQADQFKESFRAAIDGSKPLSAQHLSGEEICAYHAGDKSAEEEARIQDHLVECRECAALLLDLAAFSEPAGEPNTGDDVSRAWREFKGAAALASGMSTQNVVVDFESRRPRRMSPLTVGLAIAASLIFVMLVGGIWLSRRRGAPTRIAGHTETTPPAQSPPGSENLPAPSPTPPTGASPAVVTPSPGKTNIAPEQSSPSETLVAKNIVPVELYPNEALRGDDGAKAVQLAKDTTTFSMILHVAGATPAVYYSAVLKDSSGSLAWSARVFFEKSTNTFRLRIPAKAVRAGDYQISINGSGKDVSTRIAEYTVRFHQ
jgi:hypothetical protein